MKVRIGYMPGAFPPGEEGLTYFRDLVKVGDRYGYDSIWLSDRVVGERFSPEPLIALSMVAAYSERLKFGTSVLQLPVRNPVVLAKEMATPRLPLGGALPAGHRAGPGGPAGVRGVRGIQGEQGPPHR